MIFKKPVLSDGITESTFECKRDGLTIRGTIYRPKGDHLPIPCARSLTPEEIGGEYERNTGLVIIETFEQRGLNPMHTPGVLCTNHGPFTWGKDAAEAVHNAVVLEEVASMAIRTELLNPQVQPAPDSIRDKHFFRKHGENAYYGQ